MELEESVLLRTRALLYTLLVLLLVILGSVVYSAMRKPAKADLDFGTVPVNRQQPSDLVYQAGRQLFVANCAACHNRNMTDDLTGPALAGVEERWAKYPKKDIYQWIRGSQGMIKKKHPRAVQLWKKWQPTIMNDFPAFTDEEIKALLYYIRG